MNPAEPGPPHSTPGQAHADPSARGRDEIAALLVWIGERVRGFHSAIGLFLTFGMAVAAGALLLFVAIAALVAGGATQRVDNAVLLWMNRRSVAWLDAAALEVAALGSAYVTGAAVLIASLFLWRTHHRYSAGLLWIAMVGAWLLSTALEFLFDRPRPGLFEWRGPSVAGPSYPSGHAMLAMVVYATLAYLVIRLEPTRALRRLTLLVLAGVILLVGLARVYLGVDYPSDVLGGYLVGFAWATGCALGIDAIRHFRSRRPEVDRDERDLDREALPGGRRHEVERASIERAG